MAKSTIHPLIAALVSFVFLTAASGEVPKDIAASPSCSHCGMDRQHFAFSRVFLEYDDGSTLGVCSLHCAAVDLALHTEKTPVSIHVADLGTKELIDAEQASWVLGGDRPGVMTRRAKWAFKEKADAERFLQEHGGELVTFEEAMKAAYEDMYADTKMIREKKKRMRSGKVPAAGKHEKAGGS